MEFFGGGLGDNGRRSVEILTFLLFFLEDIFSRESKGVQCKPSPPPVTVSIVLVADDEAISPTLSVGTMKPISI